MRLRRGHAILLILVAVLAAARIALPWVARGIINSRTEDDARYRWRVKDVDVHLWRASYDLQGATLSRHSGSDSIAIFTADRLTNRLRWKPLFRSAPTMALEAYRPRLLILRDADAGPRKRAHPDWRKIMGRISLFRLSAIAIRQGEVRYQDRRAHPEVELSMRDVDIESVNLFRGGADSAQWARLHARGILMESGRFDLGLRLHPEADRPTFTLDFSLDSMDLHKLGPALDAYTGFAVAKGRMDLDAHATAAGGAYQGTVRSALHGFELSASAKDGSDKPEPGFLKKMARTAAKVAGKILELKTEKNESEGKRPPKADFSGRFPDEVQDAWSMSEFVLKESFREALKP